MIDAQNPDLLNFDAKVGLVSGAVLREGYLETETERSSPGGEVEKGSYKKTTDGFWGRSTFKRDSEESDSPEKAIQSRATLTVTRNGRELDAARMLETIFRVIHNANRLVHNFHEILKVVPKVGWTFNVEATFFEGELSYTRGYKQSEHLRDSRYIAVTPFGALKCEMKILEASLTAGFGFQVEAPSVTEWLGGKKLFEAALMAKGTANANASISHKCTWQDEREHEAKIELNAGFGVDLQATATIYGIGFDGHGGIRSKGFFCDGELVWSHSQAAHIKYNGGFGEGVAYAYFYADVIVYDYSPYVEARLWEEYPFFQGTILSEGKSAAAHEAIGASA